MMAIESTARRRARVSALFVSLSLFIPALAGATAFALAACGQTGPEPTSDASPPPTLPVLPDVASAHLQLWLTAEQGVACANGEITAWADESGNQRNAVRGAHKGPECPNTGHDLAGVHLPYFSAPPSTTPPYVDETLDVDLSFLEGKDFTIFFVERRTRDDKSAHSEILLGTNLADESQLRPPCPALLGKQLQLGYVYYDGYPALSYESVCYSPFSGTRGQVAAAPTPAALDMFRLEQGPQHAPASPTVWQNGVKVNVGGASGGPGVMLGKGALGRANYTSFDMRFAGDIAEVVIYDAALTDNERLTMEAYFKAHWQLAM